MGLRPPPTGHLCNAPLAQQHARCPRGGGGGGLSGCSQRGPRTAPCTYRGALHAARQQRRHDVTGALACCGCPFPRPASHLDCRVGSRWRPPGHRGDPRGGTARHRSPAPLEGARRPPPRSRPGGGGAPPRPAPQPGQAAPDARAAGPLPIPLLFEERRQRAESLQVLDGRGHHDAGQPGGRRPGRRHLAARSSGRAAADEEEEEQGPERRPRGRSAPRGSRTPPPPRRCSPRPSERARGHAQGWPRPTRTRRRDEGRGRGRKSRLQGGGAGGSSL